MAGLGLIASGALTASETNPSSLAMSVIGLVARFGAAGASAFCYIVAAEQFPTRVRTTALGYGAACGRVASMLAPMLVNVASAPTIYLGGIAAVATLAAFSLPETLGGGLDEVEAEGEDDGGPPLDGRVVGGLPSNEPRANSADTAQSGGPVVN